MRFKGKTVVVTGAGSGIGAQIAEDLYREGANVCLVGRTASKLEATRGRILQARSGGDKVLAYECNISSPEQTRKVFEAIQKEGLSVSGLVNNAGVNPSRNNILKTDYTDWKETLEVNLTGAFNCTKEAVAAMKTTGGGSIVNIASIAAITALEERAAYMSSKWGLVGLTHSVALDFAADKIRANCVCPGYVRTPLVDRFLDTLPPDRLQALVDAHPMKRLGTPEDISRAVLFLLSDDASWITGVVLPVDGGYRVGKEY